MSKEFVGRPKCGELRTFSTEGKRVRGQSIGSRTSDFASRNGWRQYFPGQPSARSARCRVYVTVCTHIRARDAAEPGNGGEKGVDHVYTMQRARETRRGAGARAGRIDGARILGGGAKGYSGETRFSERREKGLRVARQGHVPWK